jgi:thiamine pyrophosphate-dependent acetolactate synthase large subunit-like protein
MALNDAQRERILNSLIPPTTFSGSIQQIEAKINGVQESYNRYVESVPTVPQIPTIASLAARFAPQIPPIPSYVELKSQLYNRLKEEKQKKQDAFVEIVNVQAEEAKKPFTKKRKAVERLNSISNIIRRPNNS